jgi:hypothetical protein
MVATSDTHTPRRTTMNDAARTALASVLLLAGVASCDGGAPTAFEGWVPPPPPARPGPTLTQVTPAAGPTKGGTTVTVSGTGFSKTSAVRLDELAVPSTLVVSGVDTSLTFVTPPHFAVRVVVRVLNDDGQGTLDNALAAYTYATPFSPVTNGRWWASDDNHESAIVLYFEDGKLTTVACHTDSVTVPASAHVFSPRLVVEDGQFAFSGPNGFGITGIVTSATTAVVTVNLPPCILGNWVANPDP